jgi:hypothetical protein
MEKLIHIVLCLRVFCFFAPAGALAETWVDVPPIRNAGIGIAGDVGSRAAVPYGLSHGAATQVHENTHEINSNVRNSKGFGGTGRVNAFYVLGGKAVVLQSPRPLTLADIANTLPAALRSTRHRSHLLTPQKDGVWRGQPYEGWSDPLYVFDDWSAYLNAGHYHRGTSAGDVNTMIQTMEFFGYSMHLLILVEEHKRRNPTWQYDVEGMRRVVKYQAERTSRLYAAMRRDRSLGVERADSWLYTLQEARGASVMRSWMLHIYGKEWCSRFWVVTKI